MQYTDRYGMQTIYREPEMKRPLDAESYIRDRYLNGPIADLVRRTFEVVPHVTEDILDESIKCYMQNLRMRQGHRLL